MQQEFEQHRQTAANAFQELYAYVEKTKKEMRGGSTVESSPIMPSKALNFNSNGNADTTLLERIEKIERNLSIKGAAGKKSTSAAGEQPKIIRDAMTDSIKLEETLIDYMEIIVSMNSKLNSHINSTKLSLGELEDRIAVAPADGNVDQSYLKTRK